MTLTPRQELHCGDVGYIITGIKDAKEIKVGDTLTHVVNPCPEAPRIFRSKANGFRWNLSY